MYGERVLVRLVIRFVAALIGIAVGIIVAAAVLSKFSVTADAVVWATLLFWVIHLGVQLIALRVLVREPSVALAGLLALASTIVSLIIVNLIVDGLRIRGISTYVFATVIIWITTSLGDMIGRRMVRAKRREKEAR
jgi:putative membrane protein